jgi:diacylglycerol O-acyltransferase / wax synthase
VLDTLRGRLHLVPRYRQKLSVPPAGTGRPLWIDDPNFSIEYHVRHTALPHPGSEEQLLLLAGRIFSQQLDRSKPLWEVWMVEGLGNGGFALITKTHHALIDGIAGVDIAQVIFDLSPVPTEVPHPDEPWQPAPEPTGAQLLASGTVGLLRTGLRTAATAAALATRPAEALRSARVAAEGLGEVAWAGLNPAPPTPLNVEIGPHRRFLVVRNELADFKAVKDAFGGTVNDVVLTVVSGALRTWLHSRGVRTEGMELRALVPVSIRSQDERGTMGNRLAAMRGPLPVYVEDPIARLRTVKAGMDGLKESKQAVGAEVLASVQKFAPPTILAQASRLNFSTRLFNLIVTNVPGPQFPLYVCGREMLDVFPVAFLPKEHALAIAIMSYNGRMNFGLLGDYDALPDIATIAEGIEASLAELLDLAREHKREAARAPASV